MTEPVAKETVEVALDEGAAHALREANRWESDALAQLGQAYLQHREAAHRLELATQHLRACEDRAAHATKQRNQVYVAAVTALSLPPGEWNFSSEDGKMMKKGDEDA